MEEISALAAAETIAILNKTDVTMVSQIPYKIIKGLIDKANDYEGEIVLKETTSLIEQPISEEARSILLILYREYWASDEEKVNLDQQLIESEKEFEKEEAEKLNPFKDTQTHTQSIESSSNDQISPTSTALIETHKKWYVRIFDKIIRFFRKK